MILLIDNYDSFVHNLGRYVENLGHDVRIVRNDRITVAEIAALRAEAVVISPGPCGPNEAGICIDLIRTLGQNTPILGVCLGHQCIAEAFGGFVTKSPAPVHGRASSVTHTDTRLFTGIPCPFDAARYHSLAVELDENTPLIVTAHTTDGVIMAMEHTDYPVYGVQFHPESILTPYGGTVMENFLSLAAEWNGKVKSERTA